VRTTLPSACPLDCPDRCALDVTVAGSTVIRIDGSDRFPFTDGLICGKVRRFGQRVHGKYRVSQPMILDGPKGSGRFRPATWDEALDRIAAEFRSALASDGGAALLPVSYGGSNGWLTGGGLDERFWARIGATTLLRTLCAANAKAGTSAVYGDLPSADLADVELAGGVLLWGNNPSASGIHLVPRIRALQDRGGKLVVVDPRRTPLAGLADVHLQPLPGTDVALALAMAHVAFRDGLADRAFLAAHAADAEAFEAGVAEWTPARAAALCGVDPAAIEAAAHLYGATRPMFLRPGWGLERTRNGSDAMRAVVSLPAVFGQFGVRGGGWCLSTTSGYRVDAARWQRVPGAPPAPRVANLSALGAELRRDDPAYRVVYVYNCNPAATVPDQAAVVAGLSAPGRFVVVHEQVWTDTCALADVVLPATTFLEHRELVRSYSHYAVHYAEAVIPPVGAARSNHAVFQALAQRLGFGDEPAFALDDEALAAEIAGTLPTQDAWEVLRTRHFLELPRPVQYGPAGPAAPIRLVGARGLPRYRPPPTGAELPLILISPATARAVSSTGYETLAAGSAALEIATHDAAARGILDGAPVRIFSPLGEVHALARVTDALRPGVVSMPKGLWRSATANHWTSNRLIPGHLDEHGGGACYNDARVEVAAR
jgi:anaerobic selenocysteine-containing dehydrogenase